MYRNGKMTFHNDKSFSSITSLKSAVVYFTVCIAGSFRMQSSVNYYLMIVIKITNNVAMVFSKVAI